MLDPHDVDDGHRDVDRARRPAARRRRRRSTWEELRRRPRSPTGGPSTSRCRDLVAPPEDFAARGREIADAQRDCPARPRARCARWSTTRSSTVPGSTDVAHARRRRVGAARRASARTWRTSSIGGAARRSASRPATSPATSTRAPTPSVGETVAGESHAWVEWWDDGWHGFDPTNDLEPGDRYVVVATGRDYLDVRPLHGIFSGAGTSSMSVEVDVTRLA